MIHIPDPEPLSLSRYIASMPPWVSWCPHGNLYLHHLTAQKRADLSLVAAVDFGCIHTVTRREEEKGEGAQKAGERLSVLEVSIGDLRGLLRVCLQLL